MRRTVDEALADLRDWLQIQLGAAGAAARPGIHVFVYAPEWEAAMLARYPGLVADLARDGLDVELVDVGQGFREALEADPGLVDGLRDLELDGRDLLLHDLRVLAETYLVEMLRRPPASGAVARIVINTGALATFVSYSAVASALRGDGPNPAVAIPTVLAFPGEGDDRALSLLHLRSDSNYRIPRL